jgi:hypothetical protein
MLCGELLVQADDITIHQQYVKQRSTLNSQSIIMKKTQADILMEELTTLIEKQMITTATQRYQSWISEQSWKRIDEKSET